MNATEAIRKLEEMRRRAFSGEATLTARKYQDVNGRVFADTAEAATKAADLREEQDALAVAIAALGHCRLDERKT